MEPTLVRNSLSDQISDRLRWDIITGALADRTHLVEESLAARYGVSRGPVREALRALAVEGLVEAVRGRIYVQSLGPHDVAELYSLRTAIEPVALRTAADAEGLLPALEEAVRTMASAGAVGDEGLMADADLAFHSALYRLSGNGRLLDTWLRYAPTFAVLLRLSNMPDPESAVEDHERIIDFIRTQPLGAAEEELVAHIGRGEVIVHQRVVDLTAAKPIRP